MNLIHLHDGPAPRYMGLTAHPFDLAKPPADRVTAKPYAKSGLKPSKLQQSVVALMSEAERKAARILRDNSRLAINTTGPSLADKDKTARIVGKKNSARSQ